MTTEFHFYTDLAKNKFDFKTIEFVLKKYSFEYQIHRTPVSAKYSHVVKVIVCERIPDFPLRLIQKQLIIVKGYSTCLQPPSEAELIMAKESI